MRRNLCFILTLCMLTATYGQNNPKVKDMEQQRNRLEQEISEAEKLLTSTQTDADSQ